MVKRCQLEEVTQSLYSPGVIKGDENLIRLIVSPHHWDTETGTIKPAAFTRFELSNRGASIQRRNYTRKEFIENLGDEQSAKKTGRSFMGVITAICSKIREIQDNNFLQCFSVLDSAYEDNIGHADIFLSNDYMKSHQLKYREKLINIFCNLTKIDEIYS